MGKARELPVQTVSDSTKALNLADLIYQDSVGVWINGSFVLLPVGSGDTDPGNANSDYNTNVAARDLVNGRSSTRQEGGQVEDVHLMFDRQQAVFSKGLATESYLAGPKTGRGYSTAARRTLRKYEADIPHFGMVA